MDDALGRCPYCHEAVLARFAFVSCRACLARHHGACWLEHNACATCGEERCLTDARPEQFLDLRWGTPDELVAAVAPAHRERTAQTLRLSSALCLLVAAASIAALPLAGFIALPFLAVGVFFGVLGVWLRHERRRWVIAVRPRAGSESSVHRPVPQKERAR